MDFEWDIPDEYNLPGVIESHAAAFGERVAVRFHDDTGTSTERTYADLRTDMNRFANALAGSRYDGFFVAIVLAGPIQKVGSQQWFLHSVWDQRPTNEYSW